MSDATTEGYTATDAEIDGMVRNLCAYALSEPEPLQRYVELTHQQVLFQGMVEALQRRRGRALADFLVAGASAAEAVAKTNLTTPAQLTKLIKLAGEADRVKAASAKTPAKTAKAAKASPAKTKGRSLNMLPPVAGPAERRILTAEERIALGLPGDGPLPRGAAKPGSGAAKPRKKRV